MAIYDVELNKHTYIQKNVLFLFLAPYARTTRHEEAFLPEGKKRPHYKYLIYPLLILNGVNSKQVVQKITKKNAYNTTHLFHYEDMHACAWCAGGVQYIPWY